MHVDRFLSNTDWLVCYITTFICQKLFQTIFNSFHPKSLEKRMLMRSILARGKCLEILMQFSDIKQLSIQTVRLFIVSMLIFL